MFQNITETQNTNENLANTKNIFANVIQKKYIILYLITFMVSTINMGYAISPFSIAMIVACISNEIPIIGITIIAAIANSITSGLSGTISLALILLIFFASFFIKEPRYNESTKNEKVLLAKRIFLCTLIVGILKLISNQILMYDVLTAIFLAIIVTIFYKLFVNAITVLINFNEKMAFSIEEVLATSLLLAIAVCSFGDLTILGFSIRNVLSIFIVLVLGWKHGMLIRNNSRSYNRGFFGNNCK